MPPYFVTQERVVTCKLDPKTHLDPNSHLWRNGIRMPGQISPPYHLKVGGLEQGDKHVTLSFILVTLGNDAIGKNDIKRTRILQTCFPFLTPKSPSMKRCSSQYKTARPLCISSFDLSLSIDCLSSTLQGQISNVYNFTQAQILWIKY